MFDLASHLRAASDAPPPTGLDLDRLITRERRRGRLVRAGAVGFAAVVAVAVGVALVPLVNPPERPAGSRFGGPADSAPGSPVPVMDPTTGTVGCAPNTLVVTGPDPVVQSHDTVRDRPTESPDDAVPRLSAVLRAELARLLPGAGLVDSLHVGCPELRFHFHPRYLEYQAGARITTANAAVAFRVTIAPTARSATGCPGGDTGCQRITLSDSSYALVEGADGSARERSVVVVRGDGISVVLDVSAENGSTPPLTADELVALGTAAGLTLYP